MKNLIKSSDEEAEGSLAIRNFGSSKTKKAFTLAEVLITIIIIGIIAALVIPGAIRRYQRQTTVAKLKVAYSVITRAFQAAELKYGSIASWDINKYKQLNATDEESKASTDDMVNTFFVPFVHAVRYGREKYEDLGYKNGIFYPNGRIWAQGTDASYTVTLENGMFVMFTKVRAVSRNNPGQSISTSLIIAVDIDGPNHGANTFGKDIFAFEKFFTNDIQLSRLMPYGIYQATYYLSTDSFTYSFRDRSVMLQGCTSNGQPCGGLIIMDGWKISDDYPWL